MLALAQLAFYGGLATLLVGLPVLIWLWIRACRDLHRIAQALEDLRHQDMLGRITAISQTRSGSATEPGAALSAFGR